MSDINQHRRINDILLGPLERPTLKWLAARMPMWITPDICTMIGVFGALFTAVSYLLSIYDPSFLWFASIGFIIHWLGDSLDGTLARYRHIERPIFGFFVDHVTDAFSATVIFLGLGLTPYVSFNVACLTLIAYLLLCVLVFIRTGVASEFKISYSKLGPTEIRVFAILLNAMMYFGGTQASSLSLGKMIQITFTPYDLLVAAIGLLLLSFFFVTAIRETIRLAEENK
jgi:phosphatidylglycerophosphate synthase